MCSVWLCGSYECGGCLFKQKTAYEMRISDWSSDVCSSDLWLGEPPASLAIVALRPDDGSAPFGLLVLGSNDAERFTPDMATDFLEIINGLASASLRRLKAPDQPRTAGPA